MKGNGEIMSLMTSLSVGVSGLKASQSGVNTTAHNLSNVSTQGYSRQQNLNVDFAYNTIDYTHINYSQVGMGTNVSVVRQNRDSFLDKSYRLEVGREYFYDVQTEAVAEAENVFGEMEGVAYEETLTDVWSAIEELIKEPDSIVKRTALIETANTFTRRSQDIYNQLEEYQVNLNTQIQDSVDRINQIGKEILELNRKIARYEAGPEKANDYRDSRNMLLDELAEYVRISCKEEPSGAVTVNIEGRQFVTPDYAYELDTERVDDTTIMLNVIWKGDDSVFDLEQKCTSEKNTDVGRLKGLLIARGNKVARYTDIPDQNSSKYYIKNDSGEQVFLADVYADDVRKYNNTIGASVIMSTMAGFDRLVHGVVTAINDALCPNETIDSALAELGMTTDTDSISYSNTRTIGGVTVREEIVITEEGKQTLTYVNDELVDDGGDIDTSFTLSDVRIWDEYSAGIGMDADNTPREALFNRQYKERYSEAVIQVTDEEGNTYDKTVWVYNEEEEEDPYSLFTIKQLIMNEEIEQDPSKIPLSGNIYKGYFGAYDAESCTRLEEIWDEEFATLNPNVLTASTFTEYYTAFMGDIATKGNEYQGMYKNQEDLVESIDSSRQEVSGVNSDEELTNMIMYQHAYNASSRYITAVDQMLEHLLAKLG